MEKKLLKKWNKRTLKNKTKQNKKKTKLKEQKASKKNLRQTVVAHALDPSSREAGRGRAMKRKPVLKNQEEKCVCVLSPLPLMASHTLCIAHP